MRRQPFGQQARREAVAARARVDPGFVEALTGPGQVGTGSTQPGQRRPADVVAERRQATEVPSCRLLPWML